MQPNEHHRLCLQSQTRADQRLAVARNLLLTGGRQENFEDSFLKNLQIWRQHQTQQTYQKDLLNLIKELLTVKKPLSESPSIKSQILSSNTDFFKVLQNLTRVLLQNSFLPKKIDFIEELYSFAMQNYATLYEVILDIQKKEQINSKLQKTNRNQVLSNNRPFNFSFTTKTEVRQAIHQNQHYKEKLNIAYHFFGLLLLSHRSLPLLIRVMNQSFSNLYQAKQALTSVSLIFFKILECLLEMLRKIQLGYMINLNQRLQKEKCQLVSNAFTTSVLQTIYKIFQKRVPMQKNADFIPWIRGVKKLIFLVKELNNMSVAMHKEKQKGIINFLTQKMFLSGQVVECIGAVASCLELYLKNQTNEINDHSQQNQIFDYVISLQNRDIRNLPLRSIQVVSFYQKCIIRLTKRAQEKTLQWKHNNLCQKILQQIYNALPVESEYIISVRCKLRLYQMIETFFKIKDQRGFFSKMANVLRQKRQTFSPEQFLFQGISAIYSQNILHSAKDKIQQNRYEINNGERGYSYLPYMKTLRVSIQKFKARLNQNYKFYTEKFRVSQIGAIFDDPVTLEKFYSGILLQACSIHLFLSKIPCELGIQNRQIAQKLFIYLYNAISFFPSPRRLTKNNFPKEINLSWFSQNVSRYIAEVINLLLEKNSQVWQQNDETPFFQDLNLSLLINQFTTKAISAIQDGMKTACEATPENLGDELISQNTFEKDPLALAEPMCTIIFFLIDKFHFTVNLGQAIKVVDCLRKLTEVVKNWQGQNVPYKEPLFNKLCSLAVKIIRQNPLKKAFNAEGVLLVKTQVIAEAIFKILDGILVILSNKQKKQQKLKNPQKYICFLNLFNELTLSFGRKYVLIDGKTKKQKLIRQNPLFNVFAKKVLSCDNQMMKLGYQSYSSIMNIKNYDYKIMLSEIFKGVSKDKENTSKFILNPLIEAESFQIIQNRQIWLKVLQTFRYMMISQSFKGQNTVLSKLTKFLGNYSGKMKISQHLKGQETIIELFINKLQCQKSKLQLSPFEKPTLVALDPTLSPSTIIQLLRKQIQLMNQIISLYFPNKLLNRAQLSTRIENNNTNQANFNINCSKGKLQIKALTIDDYIEVLKGIKSISYLLARLVLICFQKSFGFEQSEQKKNSKFFSQISDSLNSLKLTVKNVKITQIKSEYDELDKKHQFSSLKTIIELSLSYIRLIIQEKWLYLANGTKVANKFRQCLKSTPQNLKPSQTETHNKGWIEESAKVRQRRRNANIYQPTLEQQYDQLRKSYKQRFETFFESSVTNYSQQPQNTVSIRRKQVNPALRS